MLRYSWLRLHQDLRSARHSARPRTCKPGVEKLEDRCVPATLTVNTIADDNLRDSVLALREAILVANGNLAFGTLTAGEQGQVSGALNNPGLDSVAFNIGGGGVQTIAPTSALPAVSDPLTIDGTTQPGFAGSPVIELNGAGAGASSHGLLIGAGSSTVRGLVINRFSFNGIVLHTNGGNVVEGNYIGTDVTGTAGLGNQFHGVQVSSNANRVGTNGDGVNDGAERNLISGNGNVTTNDGAGILVSIADNNIIAGNYLGTDITGTAALPNRWGVRMGSNGDFNRIGTNGDGVADAAEGNLISGNLFHGVQIFGAVGAPNTNNIVAGNYIGTNASGTAALANGQNGIALGFAANNRIGTNGDGLADDAERNVISGNVDHGVIIFGSSGAESNNNVIAGNYVGTNASGTAAVANGRTGVVFSGPTQFNRIGTNGDGVADEAERNLISGNTFEGVFFFGVGVDDNILAGNYIGTDVTGSAAIPNARTGGVAITAGARRNRVGTDGNGVADEAERNVISGNIGNGVFVGDVGTDENVIAGNYIGTNAAGTAALANTTNGIHLFTGPQANRIGTNGDGVGDAAERNVLSGNAAHGVHISGIGTNENLVAGNYIGTNVAGGTALPNSGHGVFITNGSQANRIGTNGDGSGDTAERNIISGNVFHGVLVLGTGTDDNVVAGNYIGTDATGMAALGNLTSGIFIQQGPQRTRIGTNGDGVADDAERNVLSANGNFGVGVGAGFVTTSNNVIAGNYIGTNAAGTAALGNVQFGVAMSGGAQANRVGTNGDGLADGAERNLISGNVLDGVAFFNSGTDDNVVAGNYIGTDVTGSVALPNLGTGGVTINTGPRRTRIGTDGNGVADDAERNVISGNAQNGILMFNDVQESVIAGNYIGVNALGTAALGNGHRGVLLSVGPQRNRIGTDGNGVGDAAERNIVSGNVFTGVELHSPGTNQNTVAGNYIGTNAAGTAALGNGLHGVLIQLGAQGNVVGGPTAALQNTIAFNSFAGVRIADAGTTGSRVQGNSIHSNGGLGIDLDGVGVTANDLGDGDTGPNNLQNFPVLDFAIPGAITQVVGSLNSTGNTTFTLDFYASAAADASGHGEGQRYLGSTSVLTDGSGNVTFNVLTGTSAVGEAITATATDPDGNTSEFSAVPLNAPPTVEANGPYLVAEGGSVVLSSAGSSDSDGTLVAYEWDFDYDGVAFDIDATGASPTFAAGTADGTVALTIALRVRDNAGATALDTASLTIANAAPTAGVTGPTDGVPGQPRAFNVSALDPSAADNAAGFEYAINWNDGSPVQVVSRTANNGSGVGVDHVFTTTGTFTVQVTGTDKDNGTSVAATHVITITVVALQTDPCDPTKTALVVGGTLGDDRIRFRHGNDHHHDDDDDDHGDDDDDDGDDQYDDGSGSIRVVVNGVWHGTFTPTGHIIAYGQAGNDKIKVASGINRSSWLFGGDGNDRLRGGRGDDVLLGEAGDDDLKGRRGLDLMIGGLGADDLKGNADGDLLIAGTTAHDASLAALCAIMAEWTSDRDYATRVANLRGTGTGPRANGDVFLVADGPARTVYDDGAVDVLKGQDGSDWYFANLDTGVLDDLKGVQGSELVDDID